MHSNEKKNKKNTQNKKKKKKKKRQKRFHSKTCVSPYAIIIVSFEFVWMTLSISGYKTMICHLDYRVSISAMEFDEKRVNETKLRFFFLFEIPLFK